MTDPAGAVRRARPFLRWPGGKSWLVDRSDINLRTFKPRRYFEPFLGSGAVFFELGHKKAVLSDVNAELISTYIAVRDTPRKVLKELLGMDESESSYYRIREAAPTNPIEGAARFLYLNRLGFSGIYRVNGRGQFNVPYGGPGRSLGYFARDDRLLRASRALRQTEIFVSDFFSSIELSGAGDLVYCDPVYLMPGSSSYFRRYTTRPFDRDDLHRLVTAIDNAVDRGATVLLSWMMDGVKLPRSHHPPRVHEVSRLSTIAPKARKAVARQEALLLFEPAPTTATIPQGQPGRASDQGRSAL
jgi:DNA adenine methylase